MQGNKMPVLLQIQRQSGLPIYEAEKVHKTHGELPARIKKIKTMKTNLLKLKRQSPFLFSVLYGRAFRARRMAAAMYKCNRLMNELEKSCEKRADEAWGYDWERETYDACVLGRFLVNDIRERLNNESD